MALFNLFTKIRRISSLGFNQTESSESAQTDDPWSKGKSAWSLWWKFLKGHWSFYMVGILTVMLTDAMQVLATRNLGWIIDFFDEQERPFFLPEAIDREQGFFILFAVLVLSRVLLTAGRIGWRFTLARQTHKATAYLREKIWDRVRFFSKKDLDERFTKGHLMNASTSDVGAARFIFGFTLVAVVDVVSLVTFALGTLFTIHVPMTLIALMGLLGIPFFVRKLSSLEIQRHGKAQEFLGKFNDLSSQVVSTIRLQRLTQTGGYWKKRLLDSAEDYRQKRLLTAFTSLKYIPLMGGSTLLTYLLLFAVGGHFVLQGRMSVGDFVAIQGLVFLLRDPLMELGFIISEFQKGMTSLKRLSEVYDHEREEHLTSSGENSVFETSKEIFESDFFDTPLLEVKNLSYTYPGSENPVFHNVNLKLYPGDRLGVRGPIGSGKSTLIQVLSGVERKGAEGEIFFLGRAFSQFEHSELRRFIGHVHQKPFLFASNIRENITLDLTLTDEEVWRYLEISCLAKDVSQFPHGLETPLGEWGLNLSGGQKQRLTLARALARRPHLLFLDDCLSAVDTVTEETILRNLDRELKNTTLVWVAHRASTLKYCTQHLDMREYAYADFDLTSDQRFSKKGSLEVSYE